MRALSRLARLERRRLAANSRYVFAETQAAAAAFFAKHGRLPTLADLHELAAAAMQYRQALWIGWPGCWVGPGGEQRAEPPAGRVIVLTWGEPESEQLAGGQG